MENTEIIGIFFNQNYKRFKKGTIINLNLDYNIEIFNSNLENKSSNLFKINDEYFLNIGKVKNDNTFSKILNTTFNTKKFDNIDYKVLIGNNGAGKTTIIEILNSLGSKSIKNLDIIDEKKGIGIFNLFGGVNIIIENYNFKNRGGGISIFNLNLKYSVDYKKLILNNFTFLQDIIVNELKITTSKNNIKRNVNLKTIQQSGTLGKSIPNKGVIIIYILTSIYLQYLNNKDYDQSFKQYLEIDIDYLDFITGFTEKEKDISELNIYINYFDFLYDTFNSYYGHTSKLKLYILLLNYYYLSWVLSVKNYNYIDILKRFFTIGKHLYNDNTYLSLYDDYIKDNKDNKFYSFLKNNNFHDILYILDENINNLKDNKLSIKGLLTEDINNIDYKDASSLINELFQKDTNFYKYDKNYDYNFFEINYNKFVDAFSDFENKYLLKFGFLFDFSISINDFSLFDLSSGELQLINLFSQIENNIDNTNHIILMFDEPEMSLHLERQRKFIYLLNNYLKSRIKGKLTIVLATHSPFIISDITKENILFMQREKENNNSIYTGFTEVKTFKEIQKESNITITNTFLGNIPELIRGGFFLDSQYGFLGEMLINKIIKNEFKIKDTINLKELKKITGDEFILEYLVFEKLSNK